MKGTLTKPLPVLLTLERYAQIEALARNAGKSKADVVRKAIDQYVDGHPIRPKNSELLTFIGAFSGPTDLSSEEYKKKHLYKKPLPLVRAKANHR